MGCINEKTWCVYQHTNVINNKKYIGQTKEQHRERRWRKDGSGYKSQQYFWRAIEKYGWSNFQTEILKDNLSKEEANIYEKELIALYQTNNPQKGYNVAVGGDGPVGVTYSEERKEKYSIMFSGKNNPHFGKPHSEETKAKISILNGVSVVQLDDNNDYVSEYRSEKEASMCTNATQHGVMRCCKGKQKTSGGYQWKYKTDWEAEHAI